jgi:hypothetical protein
MKPLCFIVQAPGVKNYLFTLISEKKFPPKSFIALGLDFTEKVIT